MAQAEEMPVLSENYLAVVAYLMQFKDKMPAFMIMERQLARGEDLSDKQIEYVLSWVTQETDYDVS